MNTKKASDLSNFGPITRYAGVFKPRSKPGLVPVNHRHGRGKVLSDCPCGECRAHFGSKLPEIDPRVLEARALRAENRRLAREKVQDTITAARLWRARWIKVGLFQAGFDYDVSRLAHRCRDGYTYFYCME